MNYYPFNVGDYTAHTAHLDPIEDIAYRRMLDAYYLREGPLPVEVADVARLIRLRSNLAEVETVLREFFELTPEGWRHARCDTEIAAYQKRVEHNRTVGARGGRPPKTRDEPAENPPGSEQKPTGFFSETPRKAKQNQEPITKAVEQDQEHVSAGADTPAAPAADPLAGFDAFWAVYPRHEAKAEARKAWATRRIGTKPELVARILADVVDRKARHGQWLDGFVPHPATYLRGQRWEDAIDTSRRANAPRAGPPENLQQRVARKNGLDRLFGGDDGQVGGALDRDGGHLRLALVE